MSKSLLFEGAGGGGRGILRARHCACRASSSRGAAAGLFGAVRNDRAARRTAGSDRDRSGRACTDWPCLCSIPPAPLMRGSGKSTPLPPPPRHGPLPPRTTSPGGCLRNAAAGSGGGAKACHCAPRTGTVTGAHSRARARARPSASRRRSGAAGACAAVARVQFSVAVATTFQPRTGGPDRRCGLGGVARQEFASAAFAGTARPGIARAGAVSQRTRAAR